MEVRMFSLLGTGHGKLACVVGLMYIGFVFLVFQCMFLHNYLCEYLRRRLVV